MPVQHLETHYQQLQQKHHSFLLFSRETLIGTPKLRLLVIDQNKLDFSIANEIALPEKTGDISMSGNGVIVGCG